jgi:CheY-like chemotaxis protein
MADTVNAVANLMWPVLVLGLVAVVYARRKAIGPKLDELVRTRNVKAQLPLGFGFEVGGQPVSAQQVVNDQRQHTEQLRQQLSLLSAQVAELRGSVPTSAEIDVAAEATAAAWLTRRVLWVDDHPSGNSYEIAACNDRGVQVKLATSTTDALQQLADDSAFDAIVTDMDRTEEGASRPTAGLTLLRELRQHEIDIPVVVYASQAAVDRHRDAALELGAVGVTADPTALLELLAINYGPRFSRRFARQVQHELERSGSDPVREPHDSPIDFKASRDGQVLGVDVKSSWGPDVSARLVRAKIDAIREASYDFPVWIVTPRGIRLPSGVDVPDGVELLSFEDLRARLTNQPGA